MLVAQCALAFQGVLAWRDHPFAWISTRVGGLALSLPTEADLVRLFFVSPKELVHDGPAEPM